MHFIFVIKYFQSDWQYNNTQHAHILFNEYFEHLLSARHAKTGV